MGILRPLDFCHRPRDPLVDLPYDQGDVVLLVAWIELANVSDNRVNQGCWRERSMTVQRFNQPMITEFFAGIIEGLSYAISIENECIARE